MIFDIETIDKIQRAIDSGDIAWLDAMTQKSSKKRRPRVAIRSALMVSAHKAKHLAKLDELQADIAIINLEDGVAPERKEAALYAARLFISHAPEHAPLLVVRVNPLGAGGEKEIELLQDVGPDGIRIPKVRSQKDIERAHSLIDPDIQIHISVETKEAFRDLAHFSSVRVRACYLGILDLLSELEIPQSVLKISNPTIDHILCKFLVDAKTAGFLPISFVYQDYKDLEGFRDWCRYERDLGLSAKGCISPKQVEIANTIFALSSQVIERARYIKERFEQMAAQGVTGFADERFGFIDEPIYKDALNILKSL